jgi:hypothetical protein
MRHVQKSSNVPRARHLHLRAGESRADYLRRAYEIVITTEAEVHMVWRGKPFLVRFLGPREHLEPRQ